MHPAQGGAGLLGLDCSNGLTVDAQQVVGETGFQRKLAHCDAAPGVEIHALVILNLPAGGLELPVDLYSSLLFRGVDGCHCTSSRLRGASSVGPGFSVTPIISYFVWPFNPLRGSITGLGFSLPILIQRKGLAFLHMTFGLRAGSVVHW
jgi:hypothetical protein